MRKDDIRETVSRAMLVAGFERGSFIWLDKPNRLVASVCGQIKVVTLGGMSKTKLERALGKIEVWGEMIEAKPARKSNGFGEAAVTDTFAHGT